MEIPKHIVRAMIMPLGLVILMWSLEAWDWFLSLIFLPDGSHRILDGFGIRPREWAGLPGIVLAPFLHQGLGHLSGNTAPLLVLSFILALTGLKRFFAATAMIILTTGAAVWLFGKPGTVHIGASGVVFGYLGFLLVKGFIERRARWIAVSIGIALIYGTYLWGLVPGQKEVSWTSHFFGFASGILASWLLAQRPAPATISVVSTSTP